jgi:predicted acylesterase/phospholipase RssA
MSGLQRPLGLFLQGGGALGAWQAGVLEELDARGLRFDKVMGFSIGAVNGSAIAFGRLPEAMVRWRELTGGALKLSPRMSPFALCSIDPLRAFFEAARDEDAAKAAMRAEFTIITSCFEDGAPINARFTPGGKDGWDGPFVDHAAASCAIPLVFPPVDIEYRGRKRRLVDGGVPMRAPLDFSPLEGCADVLVVEMVRADEVGAQKWTPWRAIDQKCREAGRTLIDDGLKGLARSKNPPRVHRLSPSIALEPMMLDFRAAGLAKMILQGAADAGAFFADPKPFRAS